MEITLTLLTKHFLTPKKKITTPLQILLRLPCSTTSLLPAYPTRTAFCSTNTSMISSFNIPDPKWPRLAIHRK